MRGACEGTVLSVHVLDIQAQVANVEGQLSAKEDLGEALTPIDFDQLKIENRQLVDRLQACNADLLTLKTQQATVAKVPHHT